MRSLADFKVVFLADDSGSMSEPAFTDEFADPSAPPPSRWGELMLNVKLVMDLVGVLTRQPLDLYFLNRPGKRDVRDFSEVQELFTAPPSGHTPTVAAIHKIVRAEEERLRSEQQLLIFIGTDGHPTDENGNPHIHAMDHCLKEMMAKHKELHVTFMACVSEEKLLEHMERWGKSYDRIGVVDEYRVERKQMKKRHGDNPGFEFTLSDYLTKALLVSVNKDIKVMFRDDWNRG